MKQYTIAQLKSLWFNYKQSVHPNDMVPCSGEGGEADLCSTEAFLKWLETTDNISEAQRDQGHLHT